MFWWVCNLFGLQWVSTEDFLVSILKILLLGLLLIFSDLFCFFRCWVVLAGLSMIPRARGSWSLPTESYSITSRCSTNSFPSKARWWPNSQTCWMQRLCWATSRMQRWGGRGGGPLGNLLLWCFSNRMFSRRAAYLCSCEHHKNKGGNKWCSDEHYLMGICTAYCETSRNLDSCLLWIPDLVLGIELNIQKNSQL